MDVSRSGYYAFHSRGTSEREITNQHLMPIIQTLFNGNRKAYGYHRMSHVLKNSGESCGYYKIANLMRKLNLRSVVKRRFKLTTGIANTAFLFTLTC